MGTNGMEWKFYLELSGTYYTYNRSNFSTTVNLLSLTNYVDLQVFW